MNIFVKFLKTFAIILFVLAGAETVGLFLNSLMNFNYLVNFFAILRHYSMIFNFTWDMPLTFYFVALIFMAESVMFGFKAYIFISKRFS